MEDGHKKTTKWLNGMGNVIKHQDGGGIITYKHFPNGAIKESNYENIRTKFEIDGWGNKKKMEDPSAGTYNYLFDNLGRLKRETNPKGGYTEYNYDDFGRIASENTISNAENTILNKNYIYDPATKLPTVITGTYNGKIFTYTTLYDPLYHRIIKKTEETPEFSYETSFTYDDFGRIDITELKTIIQNPNHTSISQVKNVYDARGILVQQNDAQTSAMIWKLNSTTAQGNPTQMNYGNGYVLNTTYSSNNLSLERIRHVKDGTKVALDITYNYNATRGTLLNRNNLSFSKDETFTYDELDRLLGEAVNNVTTQKYTYDSRGRMTYNQGVGIYNYNEENYKLESIDFNSNGSALSTSRGFAAIQYNAFKSPDKIFLDGKDRISFEHSILRTRSASYYGSLDTDYLQRPNRKFYSSDKAIEIIKEGNITKIVTYITGDPYSANYMKVDLLTGGNLTSSGKYYLHRDNQQTILAITKADASGSFVERRYFDAWGNLKGAKIGDVATIMTPNAMGWIGSLLIDRGYTGHEHLKTVGLIHMNGRIYDPYLKRFMSPDNFVQDDSTQNFNRYGYVLNNPLLYTDANGEYLILAVAVAIITNGIINSVNGVPFWYGTGKAATMGAISGVVSMGIGSMALTNFSSAINQGIFQAGMHAVTGGMLSEIQGGGFFSGFAAGAISSMVSSALQHLGSMKNYIDTNKTQYTTFASSNRALYKATMIAAGGLSGGLSSSIAGGNFWRGVQQGIITSGLNHLAHEVKGLIEANNDLDKFAKSKFGEDYKEKLGVKSLKWGSQMKVDEIKGYSYNSKEMLIIGPKGATGGITTEDGRIYISDFYKAYPSVFLEVTMGHEFIHSYHHMIFGNKYNASHSEFSAYQYSIDFTIRNANIMDSSMIDEFKKYQSSYKKGPATYDYKKAPGF